MHYPGFQVSATRAETEAETAVGFLNLISLFTDIFLKGSHAFPFTAATKCAFTQASSCINPVFSASTCPFPIVFC